MNITVYFYPILLALGLASSYTDIKYKAIRNKHLILSLGAALLIYGYLTLTKKINLNFQFILNILLGGFVGFMLYFAEIWGAGDGKLFFTYCLLMPTQKYSHLFIFPCLSLFINIFLVSLGGLIVISTPKVIKNPALILKKIFSLEAFKDISLRILILFSFSWIFWSYIGKIKLPLPLFFRFLSILLLYQLIGKLLRKINKSIPKKRQPLIFLTIILTGIILRRIVEPDVFSLAAIFRYFQYILSYFLLIHILNTALNLERSKEKLPRLAFAPFMFLGTLAANTELINIIMKIFSSLMK